MTKPVSPVQPERKPTKKFWCRDNLSPADDWTPERIRALRLSLNLSQAQFAQLLGAKTYLIVNFYENGRRHPGGIARAMLNVVEHYAKRVERARKRREALRIERREARGKLPLRNGSLHA